MNSISFKIVINILFIDFNIFQIDKNIKTIMII